MQREGKLRLTGGLIEKQAGSNRLFLDRHLLMRPGGPNDIDEGLMLLAHRAMRKAGHDLIRMDVDDPETDRLLRMLATVYERLAVLQHRGVSLNDAVLDAITATLVHRPN